MAGPLQKRTIPAAIESQGGLDPILDRIADGETMSTIAAGLGCSRTVLHEWLHETPERRAAYQRARAASAAAHAEMALEIADKASETGVAKARLQVEARQWLAAIYDPERFGRQRPGVQINIGSLHLDALRQRQVEKSDAKTIETESSR